MINRQLELGLGSSQSCSANRYRGKARRAHWWFERMRGLVEEAPDWEPAPEADIEPSRVAERFDALESGVPPRASTVAAGQKSEVAPGRAPSRWKFVRIRDIEGA